MKFDIQEYIGKHINHVTVIGECHSNAHFNSNRWVFECDCGTQFTAIPSRVLSGHKKSCGCIKGKTSLTHGCNQDEFYPTWWSMMSRCYNEKNHNFPRYGARGITVCDVWHDPKAFIDWAKETVGEKSENLTLDRIDNNKGYSPDNCRWSTMKEQSNNRCNTRLETIDGETMPLSYWCEKFQIDPAIVRYRIDHKGYSAKQALTEPTHQDNVMITINGITRNISDWCHIYGINRATAYGRIRRGWDPVEAITKPKKR